MIAATAMLLADCALGFCTLATGVHLSSVAIAARRCRRRRPPALPADRGAAPVTLLRPVCGIEAFSAETLGSSFGLDHCDYEVIFCAARADDPVVPLVRRLIAANPTTPARLLIGDERFSVNP